MDVVTGAFEVAVAVVVEAAPAPWGAAVAPGRGVAAGPPRGEWAAEPNVAPTLAAGPWHYKRFRCMGRIPGVRQALRVRGVR